MFYVLLCITLCPFLFCNHLDGEERELVALLGLSSWCFVIVVSVVWLFLALPLVCLQFVIVVFADHTRLLFFGCSVPIPRVCDISCYYKYSY